MTTTPITPERLREIAALCEEWPFRAGEPRAAIDAYRAIPELLAEVARLQGEAQADAGRMLKQYTVNAKLIEGGEYALRIVAKRDARIAALETALSELRREGNEDCTCGWTAKIDQLLAGGAHPTRAEPAPPAESDDKR